MSEFIYIKGVALILSTNLFIGGYSSLSLENRCLVTVQDTFFWFWLWGWFCFHWKWWWNLAFLDWMTYLAKILQVLQEGLGCIWNTNQLCISIFCIQLLTGKWFYMQKLISKGPPCYTSGDLQNQKINRKIHPKRKFKKKAKKSKKETLHPYRFNT